MRIVLLLACVISGFLAPPLAAQDADPMLESLAWILGDWNRIGLPDGQSGYERWHVADHGYSGVGARLKGTQVVFMEKLRIEADNDGVFYVADVPGNSSPVRFRLVEQTEASAVFENPTHDFPKRISYRMTDGRLEARVSGGGREAAFLFERASDGGKTPLPESIDTKPAMRNMINWFGIPASDLNRAVASTPSY